MMIDAGSIVSTSPIGFEIRRRRYNAPLGPRRARASDSQAAADVTERGISFLENHVASEQLAAIRREVLREDPSPKVSDNVFHAVDPEAGEVPSLREFATSPFLRDTVNAIAGSPTRLYGATAQIRPARSNVPDLDLWHTDTWRVRLKAMLFLDDVTAESGPMIYAAGSHRRSIRHPSRWLYDYLRDVRPAPWHRIADRAAGTSEHITCTGSAGTMIVFDTRGFHTATSPTSRPRSTLTLSFALERDLST